MTATSPKLILLSTLALCWALALALCWAYPPGRATAPSIPDPPPPAEARTTPATHGATGAEILGMLVIAALIALPITAAIAIAVGEGDAPGMPLILNSLFVIGAVLTVLAAVATPTTRRRRTGSPGGGGPIIYSPGLGRDRNGNPTSWTVYGGGGVIGTIRGPSWGGSQTFYPTGGLSE